MVLPGCCGIAKGDPAFRRMVATASLYQRGRSEKMNDHVTERAGSGGARRQPAISRRGGVEFYPFVAAYPIGVREHSEICVDTVRVLSLAREEGRIA
jgi:hypothetical protein